MAKRTAIRCVSVRGHSLSDEDLHHAEKLFARLVVKSMTAKGHPGRSSSKADECAERARSRSGESGKQ